MHGLFTHLRLLVAHFLIAIALLWGLTALPPTACANVIAPGTFNAGPDILTIPATSTLLASTSGPLDSATFTANYNENVYQDGNTGDLDFVIRVQDVSAVAPFSGLIEEISTASFAGFTTDVGYSLTNAPSLTAGSALPISISRSNAGDTVSWNFDPSPIEPGQTTALLVIDTNATNFTSGLISAIDAGSATVTGFGPTAIPEPTSAILLTGGAYLAFARRPRRNSAANHR